MAKDPKKQTPPSEEDQYGEFTVAEQEEGIVDPGLMGELWDDDPEPVEPEDEPVEEPEEEVEEGDEEEPEEPEEDEEEPEDGLLTYKVKDKEYDLDSLVKEGVLDDLITQAQQVSHFQKLYEEQKAQNQQFQQQYQQQQQLPPQHQMQQPPVNVEQLKAQVIPQLHQAVREGFLDEEFVEYYPNAAASQMLIYQDYLQMKQVVMGMYQHFMRDAAQRAYDGARSKYTAACSSLSSKHDLYKELGSEQEREDFFQFLAERVNPEVSALDEEFLARQYLGYKQESVLEAVRGGKNQRTKVKKKKRKLAVGEGGSPRKGGKKRTEDLDQTVIQGLMEHFDQ